MKQFEDFPEWKKTSGILCLYSLKKEVRSNQGDWVHASLWLAMFKCLISTVYKYNYINIALWKDQCTTLPLTSCVNGLIEFAFLSRDYIALYSLISVRGS